MSDAAAGAPTLSESRFDPVTRLAMALEALEGTARLTQQLHTRTPIYVRETAWAASGLTVAAIPQTSQPELIESVIVSVAAPATLTLAEMVLPLPGVGVYILAPVAILLNPSDIRQVTQNTAGALGLTLTGHQLPQWGILT